MFIRINIPHPSKSVRAVIPVSAENYASKLQSKQALEYQSANEKLIGIQKGFAFS